MVVASTQSAEKAVATITRTGAGHPVMGHDLPEELTESLIESMKWSNDKTFKKICSDCALASTFVSYLILDKQKRHASTTTGTNTANTDNVFSRKINELSNRVSESELSMKHNIDGFTCKAHRHIFHIRANLVDIHQLLSFSPLLFSSQYYLEVVPKSDKFGISNTDIGNGFGGKIQTFEGIQFLNELVVNSDTAEIRAEPQNSFLRDNTLHIQSSSDADTETAQSRNNILVVPGTGGIDTGGIGGIDTGGIGGIDTGGIGGIDTGGSDTGGTGGMDTGGTGGMDTGGTGGSDTDNTYGGTLSLRVDPRRQSVATLEKSLERLEEAKKRRRCRMEYEEMAIEVSKKKTRQNCEISTLQEETKLKTAVEELQVIEARLRHKQRQCDIALQHVKVFMENIKQTTK